MANKFANSNPIRSYLSIFIIYIIRAYQSNAPNWIRSACRYEPSCSEYSIIALQKYGLLKGLFLAVFRIIRCFPPFGGKDFP